MTRGDSLEQLLCRLAAVSEELARQLEWRDPRYLESLEAREELLAELLAQLPSASSSPAARAALERIRQIGETCQRRAQAMRRQVERDLAALDAELAYAESLRRLSGPDEGGLLNLRG
jgi:aspartate aminotransferase-like enzyme